MAHYRYLIVGSGMTAAAALGGIRQTDPEGAIGLISQESHPPYNRAPLSSRTCLDRWQNPGRMTQGN